MAKDFVETLNTSSYKSNGEITNLTGIHLVKGSHDCLVVNKEKVASRKGYTVVGADKTKAKGHKSSFDWETNRKITRSGRLNDSGELEVYFNGAWELLKLFNANTKAEFTPWWNDTELIDQLLFVIGTDDVYSWGGGMAEIAATTATTVSIKGYITGTTIAFVDGGASPDTITDSGSGFLTAGFEADDVITIAGSASNDGSYTIASVVAGTITLYPDDELTNEAAGATVIAQKPGATWAEQGFLTAGTRSVRINDIEYVYTGGESTGTLTGLTGVSGVSAGDTCMQAIASTSPATLTGLTLDFISTYNNHVFYGDDTDRNIYISKSSDYTDFGYTTPLRVPGEGYELNLDSTPTAFIPDGGPGEMHIHGRKDDMYKIVFRLSADLGDESVTIEKIPSATGQAAISQASIIKIKNATAFLSFEPTIDTIGRIGSIDTPTSLPLSNDIKDDLLSYDRTDAHGIFDQNQIFITFPREGKVLIFDTEMQIWQPPQNLPVGRLALIDIDEDGTQVLCGHSSVSNETYKLFDGYNDNGGKISCEMRFGYENYGTRLSQKLFDEAGTELYMSENTNVTNEILYDYKGATGVKEFEIRGDDESIRFTPVVAGGIGLSPLGSSPLGSLATEVDDLSKYRVVDTMPALNFFERQRSFKADGVDIRFAVIAFGENVEISDSIPSFIKR